MTKKLSNEQKVFNKSYRFIVKQGAPSVNKWGDCQNQGEGGKRCAVACLLNKEELTEAGEAVEYTRSMVAKKYNVERPLLVSLVDAHDDAASKADLEGLDFLEQFQKNARWVAQAYKLTVPEVE